MRSTCSGGSTRFRFGSPGLLQPGRGRRLPGDDGGLASVQGTPVELSFAWQRRQGLQRAIQHEMTGLGSRPLAIWLPLFPSAAGFGAVMKNAAGGNTPARWFSQTDAGTCRGDAATSSLANRFLPFALRFGPHRAAPARSTSRPRTPSRSWPWLRAMVERARGGGSDGLRQLHHGGGPLGARPRRRPERRRHLPEQRAGDAGEAGGHAWRRGCGPNPTYAFMPEGTMAIACDQCDDEEYHLWDHEVAVVTRRRSRGDGTGGRRLLLDEPGRRGAPGAGQRGERRLRRRPAGPSTARAPSAAWACAPASPTSGGSRKVVAAGISLDGEAPSTAWPRWRSPTRLGGGPGDYQFVEEAEAGQTLVVAARHPRGRTGRRGHGARRRSGPRDPATSMVCWPIRSGAARRCAVRRSCPPA